MKADHCTIVTRSFLVTRALHARVAPAAVVQERGALHVAFSGVAAASFNTAFITEPVDRPREEIAEFTTWAQGLDVPYHVFLRDGVDARTEEALRSNGYALVDTEPWMLGDVVTVDPTGAVDAPDHLEIRSVDAPDGFDLHRRAAARAFDMREDLVVEAFPDALLDDDRLSWFTGFVEGVAVATLAAAHVDRVLTLQNVGTLADHRCRGYATALTRHAQFLAYRLGCVHVALQASPMGERLYRRLGFRAACHYRIFASPRVI